MSDITLDDLRRIVIVPDPDGEVADLLAELEDNSALLPVTLDELLTVVADAVQPGRLVVETPCEHGEMARHYVPSGRSPWGWCEGGSRRIIPTGDTK